MDFASVKYRVALIGNPNCGKTTLFNLLTGSNQYVGNWPGVTVEKKEGIMLAREDVLVADLPGVYSLSPYTAEEVVTRRYVLEEKPDLVINIVDGTNLERNLYLTTQVMELGIPVVLAVNMLDLVKARGYRIDLARLGRCMHCRAVAISALKNKGIENLLGALAESFGKPAYYVAFSEDVEKVLSDISRCLPESVPPRQRRWFSVKLFEHDRRTLQKVSLPVGMEALISAVEMKREDDGEGIIAFERYHFVESVIGDFYYKDSGSVTPTEKIDSIVTNRWLSLPIFVFIMLFIYYVSVTLVGGLVTDFINRTVFGEWVSGGLSDFFARNGVSPALKGLVVDGIVGGVGAVLGFLPQMLVLFMMLAILEECGYMSRIAFILDRLFRRFGLSGKSFIPMLVGTGCGVPGIMASRTIENLSDRRMTIVTTTFMPCGAKMPVVALIAGTVMQGAWWVAPSAYFAGVMAVIVSGLILKKTRPFQSRITPFVMELPDYHFPKPSSILTTTWDRGFSFVKKAGTIIMLSSVLIWILANMGFAAGGGIGHVPVDKSFLAWIGGLLAPLFAPLGFGNWQSAVSSLMGLTAKEQLVAVFGVLYGMGAEGPRIAEHFTTQAAYSFMIFNLLCAPCFAAVGAIRQETGSLKWTLFAIGYQTVFAYVVAFIIYQASLWLQGGRFAAATAAAVAAFLAIAYLVARPRPKNIS